MGRHHTKTGVVVEVVDVVLVAAGATGVPLIVVEGTTAQHTALIGQPRRHWRHDHYTATVQKSF